MPRLWVKYKKEREKNAEILQQPLISNVAFDWSHTKSITQMLKVQIIVQLIKTF